jgi:hypothetical protein
MSKEKQKLNWKYKIVKCPFCCEVSEEIDGVLACGGFASIE